MVEIPVRHTSFLSKLDVCMWEGGDRKLSIMHAILNLKLVAAGTSQLFAEHREENMRICMRSDAEVIVKRINGKIVYETQQMILRFIEIWQATFPNASFSFAREDRVVCEGQLRNNESDISSEIYPIQRSIKDSFLYIPVPYSRSRISFLTGYDIANITRADVASALDSVNLFQDQVYWLIFSFALLFILLVVVASIFAHRRELLWLGMMDLVEPIGYQPRRRQSRRSIITQQGYLRRIALSRVRLFFRHRNDAPRWLCLLSTSFTFYLTTYFCATYSTSSVVERKPAVLDTYEKLAVHPNASVFFFDFGFGTSEPFKNAPADSVKDLG